MKIFNILYIVCTSPFFVNNYVKLRNFEVGNYFEFGWKCQPEVLLSWSVDKEGGILNFQEGEIPEEGGGERLI